MDWWLDSLDAFILTVVLILAYHVHRLVKRVESLEEQVEALTAQLDRRRPGSR